MFPLVSLFSILVVMAPLFGFLVDEGHILAVVLVLSPLFLVVGLSLVYAIIQNRVTTMCGDLVEARAFARKKKDTDR